MPKAIIFFIIGIFVTFAMIPVPQPTFAQEMPEFKASCDIKAVTVFVQGARIYKEAKVQLKPGEQTLVFDGISQNIMDESVRVLLQGKSESKISGIDIKSVSTWDLIAEKTEALQKEKTLIQDEINVLNAENTAFRSEIDFAQSVIEQMKKGGSQELEVKKLMELSTFVKNTIKNANMEILKISMKIRELTQKSAEIAKKMSELRFSVPARQKNILIRIAAPAKSQETLEISYIVPDASWKPSYDVRYLSDVEKAEIISYGVITQNTGENWDKVDLTLSTAEASASVALPKFLPKVVHLGDYEVDETNEEYELLEKFKNAQNFNSRMLRNAKQAQTQNDRGAIWEPEEVTEFERESQSYFTGKLAHLLGAVVFELDQKRTIMGDGRAHRTMLSSKEFDAKIEYYARPSVTPFVFLRSMLKNDSKSPLLKGEMNIFVDSRFVGKWEMEPVAPGDEFEVYFGTENRLKIKRELTKFYNEGPTGFRSSNLISRDYKISVDNFMEEAVKVKIVEAIPITWSDTVIVRLSDSKPAVEPDELGRLTWVVDIDADGKHNIEYKYEIEYPEDDEPEVEFWSEERFAKQVESYKSKK